MAIKYKWLASILREQIQKNLKNGTAKLPTENELCRRYHVSRQTVRQALSLLQQEKLIEKKHGSGTYLTGLMRDAALNTIGILLPNIHEHIYPGILTDLHEILSANGFSEQIFETQNQIALEREILISLLGKPLRGIIVEACQSALPNPNLDLYKQLQKKGIAILFLYNYYPGLENCLYIKGNDYAGSAMLTKQLINLGHQSIGCIFKSDDIQGHHCYQGYIETIRDSGLPLLRAPICWYGAEELEALQTSQNTSFLRRIVKEKLSQCTAVICFNDEIAYWLTRELLFAGYSLPEDMCIAAFDYIRLNRQGTPPSLILTQKPHEMGIKTAQIMIDKLKGLPVHSLEIPWFLT